MTKKIKKSADDISEISKHLPTPKEEYERAQELGEMFSTTNRSGARGIKSGLGVPSIRPRGLARASKFADDFTPGKLKKPKKAFEEELPESPLNAFKKEMREKLKIMLPRQFCPDCGETDRPNKGGVINLNFCLHDTPHLGMKANDLYITILCQDCVEKAMRSTGGEDPSNSLVVEGGITLGEKKSMERAVRIKTNIEEYIKAKLAAGDHSIYVSGKRED